MTNTHHSLLRSAFALAVIVPLAGGAQPSGPSAVAEAGDGYGSSLPPSSGFYDTPDPDPYHYRCAGQCLRSF